MKRHIIILCLISLIVHLRAQETRYVDKVFSTVTVTKDIVYGNNLSILPIILQGATEPRPTDLEMDIYEPTGDTLTDRPLVIVAHRGDFLPRIINQSPYGDKGDSAVVELCMELAKRGYVTASISYRLGWNPFAEEIFRKKGVLEAVYRITQDMRTCVRYFRRDVAENGNTFEIDPTRIAVGGFDATAYAAYNVAFLKRFDQIELPKFVDFSQQPPEVFIDSSLYGNPYGTQNRPLNIANHVGYSSDVSMVFGFQGGLGDFSWIEQGDPPAISLQLMSEFPQPGIRDVTIGNTGDIIIADGARPDTIAHRSVELGNNDVWVDANFQDSLSLLAAERSGGIEGLLLLKPERREGEVQCDSTAGAPPNSNGNNSYPWNWYDELNFTTFWNFIPDQTVPGAVQVCRENLGNPNEPELSRSYVDTLARYISPRIITAMDANPVLSNSRNFISHYKVSIYPVPSNDRMHIKASSIIRGYEVLDVTGRVSQKGALLGRKELTLLNQENGSGVYFLKLQFDDGYQIHKLIWK